MIFKRIKKEGPKMMATQRGLMTVAEYEEKQALLKKLFVAAKLEQAQEKEKAK